MAHRVRLRTGAREQLVGALQISRPASEENEMVLPQSDEQLLLLHNPRCSKSRATLALLEERGAKFEVREYLSDPLSRDELATVGERLGRSARQWVRLKEAAFAEAGLSGESGDDALLDAVADHPILMERPILVRGQRAAVGRPPEDVLALLD
jgi:arsenate reductase